MMIKKISFLLSLLISSTMAVAQTGTIEGVIIDGELNETLPGAIVQVLGTSVGGASNFDGVYRLERVPAGRYTVRFSYVSYATQEEHNVEVRAGEVVRINKRLTTSSIGLNEVVVTTKRNLESENMLLLQRQQSTLAVENMGAREMSVKGISNVEDGVKKITGISVAGNSQVVVRGLADRYSITTLNGLSIASPNPDNKLIPLNLFAAAVVKNINVSKVYQAASFADYAGAHIDIESKENLGKDYLSLSLGTGGETATLGGAFLSSEKQGSPYMGYAHGLRLSPTLRQWKGRPLDAGAFATTFNVQQGRALPQLSAGISAGKSWSLRHHSLNLAVSANFTNDYFAQQDAHYSVYNNEGTLRNSRDYDEYVYQTTTSAAAQLAYHIGKQHRITYNLLYVNNTEDAYSDNFITDYEGNNLWGSNSVYHAYQLLNNQLLGTHELTRRWNLSWRTSLGITDSYEPDRRQVMYTMDENRRPTALFTLNQQETSRYFSDLAEREMMADISAAYFLTDATERRSTLRFGGAVKQKTRQFYSSSFYYNMKEFAPTVVIDNVYSPHFINDANIANGNITINKVSLPRDTYSAASIIGGGYADADVYVGSKLLLSGGVRMEMSQQWVDYAKDAGTRKKAILNAIDPFVALNAKYDLHKEHALRMAASRTITRPSFIEMAPFAYRESYGGEESRGNEEIRNGYNYNVDLRYEWFLSAGELISATLYYKWLESPIEKVQKLSSDVYYSYLNAQSAQAMGIEVEMRKNLTESLRLGFNASLMSTTVRLPLGEAYTSVKRALQGASPYLVNADLTYSPKLPKEQQLNLSLIYNLRGPRIYAVGVLGLADVMENEYHTLDFVGGYSLNNHLNLKLQVKNILNQRQQFTQTMVSTGEEKIVKHYAKGMKVDVGITYTF